MKKLTIEQIVEETVAAYNVNTRALNCRGNCVYQTEDGKNCAVGRVLKKKYRSTDIRAAVGVGALARAFNKSSLDELIYAHYTGHPIEFWSHLQCLHDNAFNWDSEGLSVKGENEKRAILERFACKK